EVVDVGRDHAEVLGDDGQLAGLEALLEGPEQLAARSLHPAAMFRGGGLGRHLPAGDEPPEVVEAQDIDELQRLAHALDPPGEALVAVPCPRVERVAPELTGRAEGVRRYAGDDQRPSRRIELPEMWPRPHVGRVEGDEDRQIADDADAGAVRV